MKKESDYTVGELKEMAKDLSLSLSYQEGEKRKYYKKNELYKNIKNVYKKIIKIKIKYLHSIYINNVSRNL